MMGNTMGRTKLSKSPGDVLPTTIKLENLWCCGKLSYNKRISKQKWEELQTYVLTKIAK